MWPPPPSLPLVLLRFSLCVCVSVGLCFWFFVVLGTKFVLFFISGQLSCNIYILFFSLCFLILKVPLAAFGYWIDWSFFYWFFHSFIVFCLRLYFDFIFQPIIFLLCFFFISKCFSLYFIPHYSAPFHKPFPLWEPWAFLVPVYREPLFPNGIGMVVVWCFGFYRLSLNSPDFNLMIPNSGLYRPCCFAPYWYPISYAAQMFLIGLPSLCSIVSYASICFPICIYC